MTGIFSNYSKFLSRENKDINGVSPSFAEEYPNYEEDNENNKGCWNCVDCSGCSDCSDCSGCSHCSGCSDCSNCCYCPRCSECSNCVDCSRCSGCDDCSGSEGCSQCADCSDCTDCFDCLCCSRCSECSNCLCCSRCSECSNCGDCSACSNCGDCSGCSNLIDKSDVKEINEQSEQAAQLMGNYPKIENIHQKVYEAASSKPEALNMSDCHTTHRREGWVVFLAGNAGKKLELHTSTLFAAMQIYNASSSIEVSPVRFYEDSVTVLEDMKRCAELEALAAR